MSTCPNLAGCGFFKKYQNDDSLVLKGFISKYCQSTMQDKCKRKEYKMKNGTAPPDDMMPNGLTKKS